MSRYLCCIATDFSCQSNNSKQFKNYQISYKFREFLSWVRFVSFFFSTVDQQSEKLITAYVQTIHKQILLKNCFVRVTNEIKYLFRVNEQINRKVFFLFFFCEYINQNVVVFFFHCFESFAQIHTYSERLKSNE